MRDPVPSKWQWFDGAGYPTDAAVMAIEDWPFTDVWNLMEFVAGLWRYEKYVTRSKASRRWRFATGGWSGNETLICALQNNFVFWSLCWLKSERGGLHVFEIPSSVKALKKSKNTK